MAGAHLWFVECAGETVAEIPDLPADHSHARLGYRVTTAVFSVVDAVFLRPLSYPNSDRLVRILESVPADETSLGVPEVGEAAISCEREAPSLFL